MCMLAHALSLARTHTHADALSLSLSHTHADALSLTHTLQDGSRHLTLFLTLSCCKAYALSLSDTARGQ